MLTAFLSLILFWACSVHAAAPKFHYGHDTTKRLTAYVTDWSLPKYIAWHKLDHVNYAFGIPDKHGHVSGFDEAQLRSIVHQAHAHHKTISLSIGGWTGSRYFSSLVANDHNRHAFADTLVNLTSTYKLDGLDIDWEYPNSENGVSCNQNNKHDSANLLKFLQLLRQKLRAASSTHKRLSVATAVTPFNDASGQPSKHLDSAWATVLDAVQIMAYDLDGYWAGETGSNAPLYTAKEDKVGSSVDDSVKAWKAAGIPTSHIVVGVPFYGYTALVTQVPKNHTQFTKINTSKPQIKGDRYDEREKDPCPGSKASYSGEYQWRSIVAQNIPHNGNGWKTYRSTETKTPYAYNIKHHRFLTYDDPRSLHAKVDYALAKRLGGIMLWSLEMDDNNHSLLNALQGIRIRR
ncbi:glycoside hydrolase [Syncephalastrum racemosum]|uniref:Glycoside hydrolase n=1 Tax=Syncephalastrum racemosum TaxID=13706 RepID=A0A1X2HSR3_SYNRA|nr:glycoside hydrolase [Syncephalastrum racemosum]